MTDYPQILQHHWLPVLKSSKLKNKPIHVTVMGEHLVLFRSKDNISALKDRCPHRNVPLSEGRVVEGCIQCPYHGWMFDASGTCQRQPGLDPSNECRSYKVQSYDASEKAGLIWIRLKSKKTEKEPVIAPHITSPDYNTQIWTTYINATLPNALENFLDGTHTHFVHAGLIRSEAVRKEIIADITPLKERVEIVYCNEGNQNGIISKWFEPERQDSKASFSIPCVAELEYADKKGPYFVVSAYLVPEVEDRLKVFALLSHRKGVIPGLLKHLAIYPFFKAVLAQDNAVLEMQQKCIDDFGKESFIVTELDLMRPYIERLLSGEDISNTRKSSTTLYL